MSKCAECGDEELAIECTECGLPTETVNRMGWCTDCERLARENPTYHGVPTKGI